MKKKTYMAPAITMTEIIEKCPILAGSQSPWAEGNRNTDGWQDYEDEEEEWPSWPSNGHELEW